MSVDFDLAIVGSGFAGSLLSMIAHRLGLKVCLLERGKHPRFAIGESTTPLMNLLIEQLALRYDLPRLLPLTTYGLWQKRYPEVVCGIKRGFTYYHHQAGERFQIEAERRNALYVAASPHNSVADTHWLRADVDAFLVGEAIALGVPYEDEALLKEAEPTAEGMILRGERHGKPLRIAARLVLDATGPRGFLSRALNLPEAPFPTYPAVQGLFSHFTNVALCGDLPDFADDGDLPYAPDDAALHHVYDGGWMWVLRFGNGVVSAGFTATEPLAATLNLADKEGAWRRFMERFPSVGAQFAKAEATRPLIHQAQVPYSCSVVAGERWALLPSASAFVDPLFSTGMPLALLGIERLGRILESCGSLSEPPQALQEYAKITREESLWTASYLSACYAAMPRFSLFSSMAMFYFAAASYSEMARRLEKPHLIRRYLAADRTDFAPALKGCIERLKCGKIEDEMAFQTEVARHIAPLNIAGLALPEKRNVYGVDLEDVIRASEKLDFAPEEMRRIIAVAPWARIPLE